MVVTKFNESSMSQDYLAALMASGYQGIENDINLCEDMAKTLFVSIVSFLQNKKNKKQPVVLRFDNIKEQFLLGARIFFDENEVSDNINVEFLTDEKDIDDGDLVISHRDDLFTEVMCMNANTVGNFSFDGVAAVRSLTITLIKTIYKWLDKNADKKDTAALELAGFFTARVAIENDEKVFAFEVDADIKRLLKDDKANEK
jgi:hypothetical protein